MKKVDFDKRHATRDDYGNVTAKNQFGVDARAKPIKKKVKTP